MNKQMTGALGALALVSGLSVACSVRTDDGSPLAGEVSVASGPNVSLVEPQAAAGGGGYPRCDDSGMSCGTSDGKPMYRWCVAFGQCSDCVTVCP